MSIVNHTVEQLDGSSFSRTDEIKIGNQPNQVANPAGATNATVTVTVSITGLPVNYSVLVNPGQACFCFVAQSSKTNGQFIVSLVPPAGGAIAAGAIDVVIIA